jgi:hypothetical protein
MNVYPATPNWTFSMFREPFWKTRMHQSPAQFERRYADHPLPLSRWTLTYEYLKEQMDSRQSGGGIGDGFFEWSTIVGFYMQQNGPGIPFLFDDPTDDTVTGGILGVADGTTQAFQFTRQQGSLGGIPSYYEPIQFLNTVSNVYDNGVVVSPSAYAIQSPGSYVVFNTPPTGGDVISADFTYYWGVVFSEDKLDTQNFMFQLWNAKTVKFEQIPVNIPPTS